MSSDIQLAFPCPHLVIEEVVALGEDRRTLIPKAPLSSTSIIRVLANDTTYIPPAGVTSRASLTGAFAGPFRIQACDTDLTVETSSASVTISIPAGHRILTDKIVQLIQGQTTDILAVNDAGRLVLTDVSSGGSESWIRVSGGASTSVGFKDQRGDRGRLVYPGWEVASGSTESYGRYLQFLQPLRGNPLIKVTYATLAEFCPRCGGTYVENDYRFNLQGDVLKVTDENLLYQSALKIILTRLQSNPFHPTYGSSIMNRIGSKAIGSTASLITEDVQNALTTLQNIQTEQAKVQPVSLKERLYAVSSVKVTADTDDPTIFRVDVVIRNAAGTPIAINIVYTAPGAVALTGTNGQSLGLASVGLSSSQATRLLR